MYICYSDVQNRLPDFEARAQFKRAGGLQR
jgi:hypothetical protein